MRILLVLLFLAASSAAAQTYSVDSSGGPLTLEEELAEAAAAWNSAAEGVELEQSTGAATSFSYADPELLGPDIVSATLVRDDEEGFEVWLNPLTLEEFPQALLHELGLLLGLSSAEAGVMDPVLSTDSPDTPTQEDLEAFAAARARVGGDIDGDGDVDISDLAALGRAYGQRGVNLAADLDGNGVVGAEDIELLRGEYSFTVPAPVGTDEKTAKPGDGSAEDD